MTRVRMLSAGFAAAAMAALVFGMRVGAATVKDFDAGDFVRVLAVLAIVALFVERAIEVTIGAWRGRTAERLLASAESARAALLSNPSNVALVEAVAAAQSETVDYRGGTRALAMRAAVVLGLVAAATGVSALDALITPQPGHAAWLFRLFDIVLTGTTIGGGSQPIHKMMSLVTTYLEAARARIDTTRPVAAGAIPPVTPGPPLM